MEDEDADSLFEGMVLFTPSHFDQSPSSPLSKPSIDDNQLSQSPSSPPSKPPIDDNLFSDLTLLNPNPPIQPHSPPDSTLISPRFGENSVSQSRLHALREEISAAINRSRSTCAAAADSRKEAARRRRAAAEELAAASANHRALESQLQDACEEEDFDSAQRISDSLVDSENQKVALLQRVRETEAYFDAVDLEMRNSLVDLVAAERNSAELFRRFASEAERDAETLVNSTETRFSKDHDEWFSSSEGLHVGRIALEIESHFFEEARANLSRSISEAVEKDCVERETLSRKKEGLVSELEELMELVRRKEEEIERTNFEIQNIEMRMAEVAEGFQEIQQNIESRHNDLQSSIDEIKSQAEVLSERKRSIDESRSDILTQTRNLNELVRESQDEAKLYAEVADLRNRVIEIISNSNQQRSKFAEEEKKLIEEVNEIHLKLSSTRGSLQDMSSKKSMIQKKISSYNQRIFFIEKRIPELEAEKRVAATARNFAEAARITSEAKSANKEKESLMSEVRKEKEELEKVEEGVEMAAKEIVELEGVLKGKEKEAGVARYRILKLTAGVATAEGMDGGDEDIDSELRDLRGKHDIDEDTEAQYSVPRVSLEDVANFGRDHLSRIAQSALLPAS